MSTALSASSQTAPRESRSWIVPVCMLFVAQITILYRLGTDMPGPLLAMFDDLALNLLSLWVLWKAFRRSTRLARYVWLLAIFSVSVFCASLLLDIYVVIFDGSRNLAELADMVSVFWFGPVSLALFLEPDFEPSRFDRIHILDFTQVILFWVAIYFLFLYLPVHEPSGPVLASWLHSTWAGSLVYDAAMASVFLLRAMLTSSRIVRALFTRLGMYLVCVCAADFCFNFFFPTLGAGSWFDAIWALLNITPIVIAATWKQPENAPNEARTPRPDRMVGNRLFPILYAFFVLILSMCIVRDHIAFALVMVSISFACSSMRLVIIQQRQQRSSQALQEEITERKRIEAQLREKEEHLEEQVEARTAELVSSEQRLRQAQKMEAIGRLAGGIAHDFNNLLTIIIGSAELLLYELPNDTSLRSYGESIRKASGQAAGLTRQLLSFSRQEEAAPTVVDLNSILLEIGEMLPRLVGEDIELGIHRAPDPAWVRINPIQLQQILVNLAVNARDAMPRGGTLTMETAQIELTEDTAGEHTPCPPGTYVLISVSDTGTGVPPEIQAQIFDPFFTTKPQGKGTGLGLFTVYGIVQQAGGAISILSEPGLGATFKIYLPLVAKDEKIAVPELPAESARGTETVLLVEDLDILRRMVSIFLQKQGYRVLEAGHPSEAIEIATKLYQSTRSTDSHDTDNEIHLLLTDVIMPGMHGPELARNIRQLYPHIKMLFISGYTADRTSFDSLPQGEYSLLEKPLQMKMLARKLREMLATPQTQTVQRTKK